MTTGECLRFLQRDIHSAVFATLGEDGRPQTRAIDIMLSGEESLFFLTARGKTFYRQLRAQEFAALCGVRNGISVSVRGKIRLAGPELLDLIFQESPYMREIYPGDTRCALEVFELYEGEGEYFDLNRRPVYRQTFTLGGARASRGGYRIGERCTGCGACLPVCPQSCIDLSARPARIRQEHCLHCGSCFEVCPAKAVELL